MKTIKLEICANSLASMQYAQAYGASRIELCQNLEIGGTTPSYGCLKMASQLKTKEVRVLIRPRGGHYCYTESEIEQMIQDVELVRSLGFEGIVIGALQADGTLDEVFLKEIFAVASGLKLTFHRAIDASDNPVENVGRLVELGFDTVLTSGTKPQAAQGIVTIKRLQQNFGRQIEVMAGGGIDQHNAVKILQNTDIRAIHLSAKSHLPLPNHWPAGKDQTGTVMQTLATDPKKISQLIDQLALGGYKIS
ncbi:MAG: copper homeostasis protein CutC [Bacteroidales bacterium]|jgi:copper homeostasis protein|nr:copper homeostasis protein CutC [Bacteroidales bacterium]HOI31734.1 copper homeostasis protein CutC [Bacteroidales bacterium]